MDPRALPVTIGELVEARRGGLWVCGWLIEFQSGADGLPASAIIASGSGICLEIDLELTALSPLRMH